MKWEPGKPPAQILELLKTEKRLQEHERMQMLRAYKANLDRVTARTEVVRGCLALERAFPELAKQEVFDAVGFAYCLAPGTVENLYYESLKVEKGA